MSAMKPSRFEEAIVDIVDPEEIATTEQVIQVRTRTLLRGAMTSRLIMPHHRFCCVVHRLPHGHGRFTRLCRTIFARRHDRWWARSCVCQLV